MRAENGVVLALLFLAAVLVVLALHAFAPSSAQTAGNELARRIRIVERRARMEGHIYTFQFTPASGEVVVMRWSAENHGKTLKAERMLPYTANLLTGTVVENTTLRDHTYTVSEHGFALTKGRVELSAPDGSHYALDIGE